MPSPFEFPTDNPELFTARPPSVFPRAPMPSEVAPEPVAELAGEPVLEFAPEPVVEQAAEVVSVEVAVIAPVAASAPVHEEEPEIEIVDSFDDAEFNAEVVEEALPSADPLAIYLSGLTAAALAAGATNEAVSAIGAVLGFERLDVAKIGGETMQSLHEAGLVTKVNGAYTRSESIVAIAQAWSVAMRGEDPDFSACGNKMLDEFSAEIVAKIANAPQRVELVRRDLRARGIAAFGLVAA